MASVNVLKFECPYCFVKLLPPVYQCASGHLICKVCIQADKYDPCPTCKSPTIIMRKDQAPLRIRNRQVEEIILEHQTHKCPWRGCCKRVKWNNLGDHKLDCIKRPGKFCSWLRIDKCEKEVQLTGLLDHLEKEHKGCRHDGQNGSLESVEFKAQFLAKEAPFGNKIFMCWIRGQDNVRNGGDRECFPFILMIAYDVSTVYWKPFVIASKAMTVDEPFICEMSLYPDLKSKDSSMISYTRPSIIHYLQDDKWNFNESCCEKIAHFRRILLIPTKSEEDSKDNSPVQHVRVYDVDDDENGYSDEDVNEDNEVDSDSFDEDEEDGDDAEMDGDDRNDHESNATSAGSSARAAANGSNKDAKDSNALNYLIRVSFRDMKTRCLYKFQAQNNYLSPSAAGAPSSSTVPKIVLEPPKPGTSASIISKSCPK